MPFFSEEHKRQFTWKFGVIIAIAFVMQMVLPMAAMPLFMFKGGMETETVRQAVSFKDKIYVLAMKIKFNFNEKQSHNTMALEELSNKDLVPVPNLALDEKLHMLVADERGIWLLYPDHYEIFDGAKVTINEKFKPQNMSQTFAAASDNEKLAVIFESKGKPWLFWVKDAEQSAPVELTAPPGSEEKYCVCSDRLVAWQGKVSHFSQFKKEIYLQTIAGDQASDWAKLGEFPVNDFKAGYDNQGLFIAGVYRGNTVGPAQMFRTTIKFARIENGQLSKPQDFMTSSSLLDFSVVSSSTGPAKIIGQGMGFGAMQIMSMDLAGTGVVKPIVLHKSAGPMKSMWMMPLVYLVPFVIIFILSLIATFMMPNYRTVQVTLQDGVKYEFAPVISRALSQVVDGLVLASPGIPVFFVARSMMDNPESPLSKLLESMNGGPQQIFTVMGAFMGVALCYGAICILYFAILEGKYGWTIGKLAFKIRVLGEEGRPSGFLRALLRNILRIVDGFFNFIVGIALIAFTDNWQRVGDLAARTVVVKKDPVYDLNSLKPEGTTASQSPGGT
jgi:uncharacterized RDD family membrane protein YckC